LEANPSDPRRIFSPLFSPCVCCESPPFLSVVFFFNEWPCHSWSRWRIFFLFSVSASAVLPRPFGTFLFLSYATCAFPFFVYLFMHLGRGLLDFFTFLNRFVVLSPMVFVVRFLGLTSLYEISIRRVVLSAAVFFRPDFWGSPRFFFFPPPTSLW